jgi:phage terminase small subunit
MGRPRLPAELHEISGACLDQPGRRRPPSPKSPRPLGDLPPELAPDAAQCWREIAGEAPPGVLTGADRGVVEIAAVLRAKFRRGEAPPAELGLLLRALCEMGMSPASRGKVAPVKPEEPPAELPWGFLKRN